MSQIRLAPLVLVILASMSGQIFAAPEIKLQGKSRTTGVWSEIEDDDGVASSDSPRGGNGTEFGSETLGDSKTREFRIQNKGNETLTISSVGSSGSQFEFVNLSPPVSVSPGSDREFEIRYTPGSSMREIIRMTIDNNDGAAGSSERRTTFRVGGDGEGPELGISGGNGTTVPVIVDGVGTPAAGDVAGRHFGTVDASDTTSVTHFFTLTNYGNKALNLSNPRFTGSGADAFNDSQVSPGTNLGAGNNRSFRIQFSPQVAGTFDAVFTVDTNDQRPGRETYTFAVRGVSVGAPAIRITGEDRNTGFFNEVDPDEDAPRDGNGTNWGSKSIGNNPHRHSFRVYNDGTDVLSVSAYESSNPIVFSVDDNLMDDISPGGSRQFEIAFNPAEPKSYTTTFRVRSNDPSLPIFSFPIGGSGSGQGIDPPEMVLEGWRLDPPGWVEVNSPSADSSPSNGTEFPSTMIGDSYSGRFRIRNLSTSSELTFDQSASTIENPSIFSITGLPTIVGAERAAEFQIVFTPDKAGPIFAFVNLFNNDPDLAGRFTFGVFGQGVAPPPPEPKVQLFGGTSFAREIQNRDERASEDTGTIIVTPAPGGRVPGKSFRIFNAGDEALVVDGHAIEGSGAAHFETDLPTGNAERLKIDPLEYAEFTVNYTGPPGGEFETFVILLCNDPEIPEFLFTVASAAGPGFGAELAIAEVHRTGGNLILIVEGAAGVRFRIEASTGLGSWGVVPGLVGLSPGIVPLNGAIAPGVSARYYRAVEE